jgi:hypothetical protein
MRSPATSERASVPDDVADALSCPADALVEALIPPAAVGAVRSIPKFRVVLPLALPTASAPA